MKNSIIIEPNRTNQAYWKEVFSSYEILLLLAWRDILVRFKQAFFGFAWAVVRPLLNTLVFVFFFGKVAKLSSEGVPYPLFVFAALLPWQFFANSVTETCHCFIQNTQLITKVYFPRATIPLAQVVVNLVDLSINLVLFFLCYFLWGTVCLKNLLFFPLFLMQAVFLTAGVSLWLSAATVRYRDFKILTPFLIQLGMFLSPVGYGSFLMEGKWKVLYSLNPMVGIIEGMRWSFFGVSSPDFLLTVGESLAMTGLIFALGTSFFRRMEKHFADRI